MPEAERAYLEQSMLNVAMEFYVAGRRCERLRANDEMLKGILFRPTPVNFSFSCEVYLKLLILIATGTKSTGHNLLELYDKLPEPAQDLVARHFRASSGDIASTREAIRWEAKVFQRWRYAYESGPMATSHVTLRQLAEACQSAIGKLRPGMSSALDERGLPRPVA